MPANNLRNDPAQTIPASNAVVDTIDSFEATVRGTADMIENSTATEGAVKQASIRAAAALREEANRYVANTTPKIEAIRTAAEVATRSAEDGAGSVGAIDVSI